MEAINTIITQMENWVKQVVVKYNICPFARQEVEGGTIRYVVVDQSNTNKVLFELLNECDYLTDNAQVETTLVILPCSFQSFTDFLDLVDLANDLLCEKDLEGIYQLAHFHPDYCFAGELASDPANYTNRSPYPCLHILREASVTRALESHPNPDGIVARNIEFSRKKGDDFFIKLLAECFNKR